MVLVLVGDFEGSFSPSVHLLSHCKVWPKSISFQKDPEKRTRIREEWEESKGDQGRETPFPLSTLTFESSIFSVQQKTKETKYPSFLSVSHFAFWSWHTKGQTLLNLFLPIVHLPPPSVRLSFSYPSPLQLLTPFFLSFPPFLPERVASPLHRFFSFFSCSPDLLPFSCLEGKEVERVRPDRNSFLTQVLFPCTFSPSRQRGLSLDPSSSRQRENNSPWSWGPHRKNFHSPSSRCRGENTVPLMLFQNQKIKCPKRSSFLLVVTIFFKDNGGNTYSWQLTKSSLTKAITNGSFPFSLLNSSPHQLIITYAREVGLAPVLANRPTRRTSSPRIATCFPPHQQD